MNSKELGYICAGLAVGAGLAALFAPKSGSKTRKHLRSRATEGIGYAKTRAGELRNSASDVIDRGTQAVSQAIERGTKVVEAVLTTPNY